jgi:acetyltransferase-like isoleucine patch superfamily enzyme
LVLVLPIAVVCAFGKIDGLYISFAQLFALFPGPAGAFLRSAFYKYTLRNCSMDTSIAFGSFFSSPHACVGENVSIGSFCVVGRARIGPRTQIASHVEIPSGRHQHSRNEHGRFRDCEYREIEIGADCWIGAAAVIMADIGQGSTIGAGSVVVNCIPAQVVAAGVPAKPLRMKGCQDPEAADTGETR